MGSIAFLGSRFTRIWVWLPVVLALAFGSAFYGQLLTGYADVPMGLFAAPGVVCLGMWLRGFDWRWLALAALLLGATANVKNEGLLLVVGVVVAAAIVLAVGREGGPLGGLGPASPGVGGGVLPWRI